MSRPWSAREPGRAENAWIREAPWGDLPRVDLAAVRERCARVVVLAAHPDDETLALGSTIAWWRAAGVVVEVVLATDGEGSHPGVLGFPAEQVRRVRRAEFEDALRELGTPAHRRLELPDGGLDAARVQLRAALAREVVGGDPGTTLVLAPWPQDGHIDHDTLGQVARDVCAEAGIACAYYPLWVWHWGGPADLPWDHAAVVVPGIDALNAKERALARYASQVTDVAGEALISRDVLSHFRRLVDVLLDPDDALRGLTGETSGLTPPAAFDAMFDRAGSAGRASSSGGPADSTDDPWGVETRWYERRRQAVIEAVLPGARLGRVLDVGSSTGVLTRALARRADSVVAYDLSARALAIARSRSVDAESAAIEWRQGAVPEVLETLEGPFDTIVFSEVGYFLDGLRVLQLLAHMERLLAPGGVVVAAHWQHPTEEIPLDGPLVQRQLELMWPPSARYADADVVVSVHPRGRE